MTKPIGSTSPADLLASDHRELDALLLQVQEGLENAEDAALVERIDRLWMRLAVHIRAEHKALFPAVMEQAPGLQSEIQELKADHDAFMTGLSTSLRILRSPNPDRTLVRHALESLRKRLTAHNRIEESRIYPLADDLPLDRRSMLIQGLQRELGTLPDRYRT